MKLGVMNPVLNSYTLEEALRYLHGLGVQSLEIGAGGFPGDAHLKPAELIGKPDKIKEFKDLRNRDCGDKLSRKSPASAKGDCRKVPQPI